MKLHDLFEGLRQFLNSNHKTWMKVTRVLKEHKLHMEEPKTFLLLLEHVQSTPLQYNLIQFHSILDCLIPTWSISLNLNTSPFSIVNEKNACCCIFVIKKRHRNVAMCLLGIFRINKNKTPRIYRTKRRNGMKWKWWWEIKRKEISKDEGQRGEAGEIEGGLFRP